MSKIFEIDYRKGSYTEQVTGTVQSNSSYQSIVQTEKGLAAQLNYYESGSGVQGATFSNYNLQVNNYLVLEFVYKITKVHPWAGGSRASIFRINIDPVVPYLLPSTTINSISLAGKDTNGKLLATGGSSTIIKRGQYNHVIILIDNISKKYQFVVNGVMNPLQSFSDPTSDISTFDGNRTIYVGSLATNFEFGKGNVLFARIYNNILSTYEINQLYIDFLNSKPLNKPIYFQPNKNILKPHELREEGLIAAYNMQPEKGKLINIAWDNPANSFNSGLTTGNLVKCQQLANGLKIPIKGYINIPNYQHIQSAINNKKLTIVSTFVAPSSNHAIIASFGSAAGGGGNGLALLAESTSIRIEVTSNSAGRQSIALSNVVAANRQYTIIGIFDLLNFKLQVYLSGVQIINSSIADPGNITISECNIGSISGATWSDSPWILNDWKCYNRILTEKEIKVYHNQFASKIVLKEDFSQYPVGAVKFGNWQKVYLGSIGEEATSSLIKKGKKFLKLTSFGTAMTQSLTAYGTWEFIFNLNISEGFYRVINFICNSTTSTRTEPLGNYSVWFVRSSGSTNINRIYLVKGTTWGAAGGDVATILNVNTSLGMDQYHTCKISRSTDGMFKIFVNDLLIGSILDNTYTTCRYLSMSAYGTFIISALTIKQGVEN